MACKGCNQRSKTRSAMSMGAGVPGSGKMRPLQSVSSTRPGFHNVEHVAGGSRTGKRLGHTH